MKVGIIVKFEKVMAKFGYMVRDLYYLLKVDKNTYHSNKTKKKEYPILLMFIYLFILIEKRIDKESFKEILVEMDKKAKEIGKKEDGS